VYFNMWRFACHTSLYAPDRSGDILTRLAVAGQFIQLGHFNDGQGDAVVYRFR
jgi:hypothetical protein